MFKLQPPATFCPAVACLWTKTTLYSFTGGVDGFRPLYGDLAFDRQGNIYGTTFLGGEFSNNGVVFELSKVNGHWTESVLHSFDPQQGTTEGSEPAAGVVFDDAGNLWGTTTQGGYYDPEDFNFGFGTIFELTPTGNGWQETVVYRFQDADFDGAWPSADLTPAIVGGNHIFFATTEAGGAGNCQAGMTLGCGTVYGTSVGSIYSFAATLNGEQPGGPISPVTVDASGRLFGTTLFLGANGYGNVYELVNGSNGWAYTSLHDFARSDGAFPYGMVVIDSIGNLYGTTSLGGAGSNCNGQPCGVIWEITP